MATNEFGIAYVAPNIEECYRAGDYESCGRLLERLPIGSVLEIDLIMFQLDEAHSFERDLMAQSLAEGAEQAVIRSIHGTLALSGQVLETGLDRSYSRFAKILDFSGYVSPAFFSYARPVKDALPFPGWHDVRRWQKMRSWFPYTKNRLVFQAADNTVQAWQFITFTG